MDRHHFVKSYDTFDVSRAILSLAVYAFLLSRIEYGYKLSDFFFFFLIDDLLLCCTLNLSILEGQKNEQNIFGFLQLKLASIFSCNGVM